MVKKDLHISNKLGLHARAAAKLVHLANRFRSAVRIKRDQQEVNGKSILGILLLAASQGTQVMIRCDGEDEESAMRAVTELIANRFDEES